ncbi:MAG: hypothetical protein AMS17_14140 [Spirochaetes bacterium DG_61]|jgi:iron complex transport system substrate-binding protein|nr:MAG: hypothetical protein AMS17_14140 [Spirochaetes bacterium DG_61]
MFKHSIRAILIVFTLFSSFSLLFGGTAVDSRGVTVRVPDEGVRVVSLSPGATETLYKLGMRDEIVGVSDYCNYPPEFVAVKPKIGGYSTPNLEKIQSLSPHVVLLNTVVPLHIKNQFEMLGIPLFVMEPKSFSDLLAMVEQFGKLFHREEEARACVLNMKEEAGKVTETIRMQSMAPIRTFIEIWYNPFYAAGRSTLPGDIVTMAGGRVVPDRGEDYPRLNEEVLLELNPEAIILGHESDREKFIEIHSNILKIYAIRNNKVFTPDPDEFLRPSPRVVKALKEIARFLHPEAF